MSISFSGHVKWARAEGWWAMETAVAAEGVKMTPDPPLCLFAGTALPLQSPAFSSHTTFTASHHRT